MEIESWVSAKENIVSSSNMGGNMVPMEKIMGLNGTGQSQLEPSQQSINLQDQVEIADLNFFRDLGPYSR